MLDARRPILTREALASILAATGLSVSMDELEVLLPPSAAIYAALDRLDALDLGDAEPAARFQLPAE